MIPIAHIELNQREFELVLRALEGYAAVIGLAKHPEADEIRAIAKKIERAEIRG